MSAARHYDALHSQMHGVVPQPQLQVDAPVQTRGMLYAKASGQGRNSRMHFLAEWVNAEQHAHLVLKQVLISWHVTVHLHASTHSLPATTITTVCLGSQWCASLCKQTIHVQLPVACSCLNKTRCSVGRAQGQQLPQHICRHVPAALQKGRHLAVRQSRHYAIRQ